MSPPALQRQLLFVIGKGGVGRTTVACALALAAGRAGRRACVVELYGSNAVAQRFHLGERDYRPRPIAPGVDTLSLTPLESLDEFGKRRLKVKALVRLLFHNRVFRTFLDAVPGLHDLFQLGKIMSLISPEQGEAPYDLVVVDAPATGHGLTLLSAARSMHEMTRRGLISDESATIDALLSDPERTGLVLVTLPDQLPVNESLQLVEELGSRKGLLCAAVANQVVISALPDAPPWPEVRAALAAENRAELIRTGDSSWQTQQRQARALSSLDEGLRAQGVSCPSLTIPRVTPHELSDDDLRRLANELAATLRGPA